MSYDWTSPEGRAALRQRFRIDGGYVLGSLRITVGSESIEPAIEAAMGAAIPLLDALEAAERERDEARGEVRVGAAMLARQCDMARDAERERDEAQAREMKLRAALGQALVGLSVDWPHRPHPDEVAALKAVYAEPVDDSALRALLAEERRTSKLMGALEAMQAAVALLPCGHPNACEVGDPARLETLHCNWCDSLAEARRAGAQACVEAARAAASVAFSRSDDFLPGDNAVLQAVERAAAGAGKEPTP